MRRALFAFVAGSALLFAACSGTSTPSSAGPGASGSGGEAGQGAAGSGASEGGAAGQGGAGGGVDVKPGGQGAGGGGDMQCGGKEYSAARVPANILILMDRSGSMADDNKWPAAKLALSAALDGADNQLRMGIMRFPEGKFDDSFVVTCTLSGFSTADCKMKYADGGCQDINTTPNVPVGPLSMTRDPIKGLMNSTQPNGGTPTRWGLKNAWAYMQALQADGEKYVLLVTDGEPTTHTPPLGGFPEGNVQCGELSDIAKETLDAAQGMPSVKTFVIGAPGTEKDTEVLSGIALNGGTGKPGCDVSLGNCHYQIGSGNFEGDLQKTLSDIAGKVASCVFEVPKGDSASVDPDLVNVSVKTMSGDTQLYKDAAHMDGWDYTDGSHTKVELFGPQCDAIKAQLASTVSVSLGCKTLLK